MLVVFRGDLEHAGAAWTKMRLNWRIHIVVVHVQRVLTKLKILGSQHQLGAMTLAARRFPSGFPWRRVVSAAWSGRAPKLGGGTAGA